MVREQKSCKQTVLKYELLKPTFPKGMGARSGLIEQSNTQLERCCYTRVPLRVYGRNVYTWFAMRAIKRFKCDIQKHQKSCLLV